jgi:MFS family permease
LQELNGRRSLMMRTDIGTEGIPAQFKWAPFEPSRVSQRGLDYFNLFLAGLLAGFGPFVAGYLTTQGWNKVEIGFVLTLAGLVGLASQVPGGELLDVVPAKRFIASLGVAMVALAALVLAIEPSFPLVLGAEILQGITGGFLGPAVPAISLGLVGHDALPMRLGRNQRFAAIGGLSPHCSWACSATSFQIARFLLPQPHLPSPL